MIKITTTSNETAPIRLQINSMRFSLTVKEAEYVIEQMCLARDHFKGAVT